MMERAEYDRLVSVYAADLRQRSDDALRKGRGIQEDRLRAMRIAAKEYLEENTALTEERARSEARLQVYEALGAIDFEAQINNRRQPLYEKGAAGVQDRVWSFLENAWMYLLEGGTDYIRENEVAVSIEKAKEAAAAQQTAGGGKSEAGEEESGAMGTLTEGVNEKTGRTVYMVRLEGRLGREEWEAVALRARSNKGYYYRKGGCFVFQTEADARNFNNIKNHERENKTSIKRDKGVQGGVPSEPQGATAPDAKANTPQEETEQGVKEALLDNEEKLALEGHFSSDEAEAARQEAEAQAKDEGIKTKSEQKRTAPAATRKKTETAKPQAKTDVQVWEEEKRKFKSAIKGGLTVSLTPYELKVTNARGEEVVAHKTETDEVMKLLIPSSHRQNRYAEGFTEELATSSLAVFRHLASHPSSLPEIRLLAEGGDATQREEMETEIENWTPLQGTAVQTVLDLWGDDSEAKAEEKKPEEKKPEEIKTAEQKPEESKAQTETQTEERVRYIVEERYSDGERDGSGALLLKEDDIFDDEAAGVEIEDPYVYLSPQAWEEARDTIRDITPWVEMRRVDIHTVESERDKTMKALVSIAMVREDKYDELLEEMKGRVDLAVNTGTGGVDVLSDRGNAFALRYTLLHPEQMERITDREKPTNNKSQENEQDNATDPRLPRGGGRGDTGEGDEPHTDRSQGDGGESKEHGTRLPGSGDGGNDGGGDSTGLPDNGRDRGQRPVSPSDGGGKADAAAGGPGDTGGGGALHAGKAEGAPDGGGDGKGVGEPDGRAGSAEDRPNAGQEPVEEQLPTDLNQRFFKYAGPLSHMSERERLENNVKALETLVNLRKEERQDATDEEKRLLSLYTGFGGLTLYERWETKTENPDLHNRLHLAVRMLDEDDELGIYDNLKKSTLTAYYTEIETARAINEFTAKEGFKGGLWLDPAIGNGHFEGTMPESILHSTTIHACEPDFITAAIARYLYPEARIEMNTLQSADLRMGRYDVVSTNDPFGLIGVTDKKWMENMTVAREVARHSLHGYFAVKKIEAAREGGLINFITSKGVMDSDSNAQIREYITQTCEIVGCCRLPNTAFKESGTSVTADVIYLRKFSSDEERQSFLDNTIYRKNILEPFLSSASKTVTTADGMKLKVSFNGYYERNPQNLLGDISAGGMYSLDEFDLEKRDNRMTIAEELEAAGDWILRQRREWFGERIYTPRGVSAFQSQDIIEEGETPWRGETENLTTGNLVIQDGKVGILRLHTDRYGVRTAYFQTNERTAELDLLQTRMYITLRDRLTALMNAQSGADKSRNALLRASLHQAYNDYVSRYKHLFEYKSRPLRYDVSSSQVFALERTETLSVSRDGSAKEVRRTTLTGMADIYNHDINISKESGQAPRTPEEAVARSLSRYGCLNEGFLKQSLGDDWMEKCGDKVYKRPEGGYEIAETYLSGDVVEKLSQAEEAAAEDLSFTRNVEALRAIQPKRLEFGNFPAHMGARWIPVSVYNEFLREAFTISGRYRRGHGREQRTEIRFYEPLSEYTFLWDTEEFGGRAGNWSSGKKRCTEIFEAALLDKDIVIYYPREGDEKPVVDKDATREANAKVADLKDEFENWLSGRLDMIKIVEDEYNRRFNRIVLPKWDGSHMEVPALSGMTLHPHQKDAVWMLLNNKGGVVDHMVGAGKTLVMQTAVMEMKRLGIARKPMLVVWKSTLEQIVQSFQEAYPNARLLAPDKNDFTPQNRDNFFAQIAINDYDCIIVTHEQFKEFNHTKEARTESMREEKNQLVACISLMSEGETSTAMNNKLKKKLAKKLADLERKIEAEEKKQENCKFYFEKMGVDCLFIDESHSFKNLRYFTQYDNVAGLGTPDGSEKANNLLIAIRHVQKMNGGDRGVTFLSGTTISNALTEMYNIFNYLRPGKMREMGLNTFDAWASTFARRSTEAEFGVTTELKPRTRFRRFEAVKELSALYNEIADVRNASNLTLPRPEERTHLVTIEPSETVTMLNDEIVKMVKNEDGSFFGIHGDEKTPWGLLAANIGKKLTVSPKLIDEKYDDETGKIFHLCENIKQKYDEFNAQKGVQLIFLDTGVSHGDGTWNAYDAIIKSLTENYGIPREEIADVHEADSDVKRKSLFQRVNNGEVRILLGGTKNMGTGVNVQKRVVAMHHMDIPWTPADVEQRNGRGVRQGNEIARDYNGNMVDVYYYAVKKTIDTYRYQLQDTKGKMINMFKTSASNMDTFEEGDGDDEGMKWATMMSILSGNPLILEKKKCEDKVENLERRKRGFIKDQTQKRQAYENLLKSKENFERLIEENRMDRVRVEAHGYKKDENGEFPKVRCSLHIDFEKKGEFDTTAELGDMIQKAMIAGKYVQLKGYGATARIVKMPQRTADGRLMYEMQLTASSAIPYTLTLQSTTLSWGQAFMHSIKKIHANAERYEREYETVMAKLEGIPHGDEPFPLEEELKAAKTALRDVTQRYEAMVDDKDDGKKEEEGEREQEGDDESEQEEQESLLGGGYYHHLEEAVNGGGFTIRESGGATTYTSPERREEEGEYVGNIRESRDTRSGETIYVVEKTRYVTREEFQVLCERARANSGYYTSFPANRGFVFRTREDADSFNFIKKNQQQTTEYEILNADRRGPDTQEEGNQGQENDERGYETAQRPAEGADNEAEAGELRGGDEEQALREGVLRDEEVQWTERADRLSALLEANGWTEQREARKCLIRSDEAFSSLSFKESGGREVSVRVESSAEDGEYGYIEISGNGQWAGFPIQKAVTNESFNAIMEKEGVALKLTEKEEMFSLEALVLTARKKSKEDEEAFEQANNDTTKTLEEITEELVTSTETGRKTDTHKIQDFGEYIMGARKDMYGIDLDLLDNITKVALADNPFSRVFKEPDLRKIAEEGLMSDEDLIWMEALLQNIKREKKPAKAKYNRYRIETWAEDTFRRIETLRNFLNSDGEGREQIKRRIREGARFNSESDKDDDNTFLAVRVLEEYGWKAGDDVDTRFLSISHPYNKTTFTIRNTETCVRYFESDDIEQVFRRTADAYRLHQGKAEGVKTDGTVLTAKPFGRKLKDSETRFRVSYFRGGSLRTVYTDSVEDTKETVARMEKQGLQCNVEPMQEFDHYTDHKIVYRDLVDGAEYVLTEEQFDTPEEAYDYIASHTEELTKELNAQIAGRLEKEGAQQGEDKTEEKKAKGIRLPKIKYQYRPFRIREDGTRILEPRVQTLLIEDKDMPTGEEYIFRQFNSDAEGWKYLKEHSEEMLDEIRPIFEACGDRKKAFFAPNKERIGEDYRHGEDITPEKLTETFGFRGVQFGNWANDRDRQMALNETYDALCDLAKVIGFDDLRMISLGGELGMAFGARGGGNFNAHYELNQVVINLTKTKGAGSLAHEWMHAVDNYLSRRDGDALGMVSDKARRRNLTGRYRKDIGSVYDITELMADSNYTKRCLGYGDYWNREHEKWARLFAEWVEHRLEEGGERNHYLSRGIEPEMFETMVKDNYNLYLKTEGRKMATPMTLEQFIQSGKGMKIGLPYPSREEALAYTPYFNEFFEGVKERIKAHTEQKETEREMLIASEGRQNSATLVLSGTEEEKAIKRNALYNTENLILKAGININYFRTENSDIKGFAENGEVYINVGVPVSLETPIHEYTHIWCAAMEKEEPQEWEHIKNLLRGTVYWDAVMKDPNYSGIHADENRMASETLARISGERGAAYMKKVEEDAVREGVTSLGEMRRRAVKALKRFWGWTSERLFAGQRPRNAEEAADLVIKDLLSHQTLKGRDTIKEEKEYERLLQQLEKATDDAERERIYERMQKCVSKVASDSLPDTVARDENGALLRYRIDDKELYDLVSGTPCILDPTRIEKTIDKWSDGEGAQSVKVFLDIQNPRVFTREEVSGLSAEEIKELTLRESPEHDGAVIKEKDGRRSMVLFKMRDARNAETPRHKHTRKISDWYRDVKQKSEYFITGSKGAAALDVVDHTHRMDDLSVAMQLDEAGWGMDEIKSLHWWEKGADGRWLYEVPFKDFHIIEDAVRNASDEDGRYSGVFTIDALPDLKRLYPDESLEIEININPTAAKERGYYYRKDEERPGKITLCLKSLKNLQEGILHEAQHFAQDMEGMEMGVSVEEIERHKKEICMTLGINPAWMKYDRHVTERLMYSSEKALERVNRICALYATDCSHFLSTPTEVLYLTNFGETMTRASVLRTMADGMDSEAAFAETLVSDILDTEPDELWQARGQRSMNWETNADGEVVRAENATKKTKEEEDLAATLTEESGKATFYIQLTEQEVGGFVRHGYHIPPLPTLPITTEKVTARTGVPVVLAVTLSREEIANSVSRSKSGEGYVLRNLPFREYKVSSIRQSSEPPMFHYSGMMFCRQDSSTLKTKAARKEQTRILVKAIEKVFPEDMRGKVRLLGHEEFEAMEMNLSDYVPHAIGLTSKDGTIYIDADRARIDTPLHELGIHRLMDLARMYQLSDIEKTILRYGETAPQTIKSEVARNYPELPKDDDLFKEECAAMAFGLQQQYRIADFLQKQEYQNWYVRLTNYVTSTLERIKGRILGKEYADLSPLKCLEGLSHEVIGNRLFSLIMQGKEIKTDKRLYREVDTEARAQIIGLEGLKRLALSGVGSDDIVLANGIGCREALDKYLQFASSANAGNGKLLQLATGMYYGPLDRKPRVEILSPSFIDDGHLIDKLGDGKVVVRLEEILQKESTLLAAYPELRDMEVSGLVRMNIGNDFSNIEKEYEETFDETKSCGVRFRAAVYKPDMQQWKESLMHEVQHAIQTIEGFEEGYPFTTPLKMREIDFLKQKAATLNATQLQNLGRTINTEYMKERGIRTQAMHTIREMLKYGKTRLVKEIAEIEKNLTHYTLSAGENEAYAVMKRAGLNKRERLSRPVNFDYFVGEDRMEPSPINELIRKTKQGKIEYNLFYGTMENMLTFKEQRERISIMELAQHYGYKVLPRQGLRCPILLHEGTGDKIGIFNPSNPSNQGFWTIGDDANKGVLYNFIATRVAMGIIPNPLQYPDSENPNFVVNKVAHDYLSIPIESREKNREFQKRIESHLTTVEAPADYTQYCTEATDTEFLKRRRLSGETIESPLFKGRFFNLNQEKMVEDGFLLKDTDKDTIAFPLWNAEGEMVGLERRCDDVKLFMAGSQKSAGIWHSNIPDRITDVVICETPIDAMSYHELRGSDTTLYIATGGNVCTEQISQVNKLLEKNKEKADVREFTFHLANDNDKAGANFNLLYVKAQLRLKYGCAVDSLPAEGEYSRLMVSFKSAEQKEAFLEKTKSSIENDEEKLKTENGETILKVSDKSNDMKESVLLEYKMNDMFAISALCDTLIKSAPLRRTHIEHAITKDFNDDLMSLKEINRIDKAHFSYEELRVNKELFMSDITSFLKSRKKPTPTQIRNKKIAEYEERQKSAVKIK